MKEHWMYDNGEIVPEEDMNTENQLKEAEEIFEEGINGKDFVDLRKAYNAKYHPPKNELFEKWEDFTGWFCGNLPDVHPLDEEAFDKAKSLGLFTHALDEAIKKTNTYNRIGPVISLAELESIRKQYTGVE